MADESIKTFYIFHGDDEYTMAEYVSTMRKQMDDEFNTTTFDGTKVSAKEVVSAAQILPFLGDKRLIIVRGMLNHLNRRGASKAAKGDLDYLAEVLPTLPQTARLVFWEDKALSDKHPILKVALATKSAFVKLFNPPQNPAKWIESQAKSYNVTIQSPASAALAAVVGSDLRAADGEIFKLATYVGEGGTITSKEVALLTSYVAEADIFAMVDALGQRNGKIALIQLNRLLLDADPLQLFGMIIRQFRMLIMAREWIDDGGSANELPKVLGSHPFVAQKIAQQARAYNSIDELEAIYNNLLETDVAIKTGKVKDRVGLEIFVAGLAKGD